MAQRKDLLKAQAFTNQRLVSAFVNRNPDNPTNPLKTAFTATFVGVMIGVLILAGSALFGFIRPGRSAAWKNENGALVTDVSSGLLFIYYQREDTGEEVLLPMADVASARLAMGSADTTTVKTDKLQGIEQDVLRGIPNAPRQLPPTKQMSPYPFRTCSTEPDAKNNRYITIEVGKESTSSPTTLADDVSVVIEADDGEHFLIMDGQYHHLYRAGGSSRSAVASYLPVVATGNAWLSALPEGQPIEPLAIDNRGGRPTTRQVQPDMMIGSVAMVEASELNPEPRYFIQLSDGLAETSFLNMATELAFFDRTKTDPTQITAAAADSNMSTTTSRLMTPGIPMGRPAAPGDQSQTPSVCATYLDPDENDGRLTPIITVGDPTPELPSIVADYPPNQAWADYIDIDPLHGALLQDYAIPDDESDNAPTFLISDQQVFGIPDAASRVALGYGAGEKNAPDVLRVPGSMIKLAGPVSVELSKHQIVPPLPADLPQEGETAPE